MRKRIIINESALQEILQGTTTKQEDSLIELFKKNKKWHEYNYMTSGDENYYPRQIFDKFLAYYKARYDTYVVYYTPQTGEKIYKVYDLNSPLRHAWFDTTSLEETKNLLERWVRSYEEERIIEKLPEECFDEWNECNELKVEVKSVPKKR